MNFSGDLKNFANFRSLEQIFLAGGQNNFGNKILFLWKIVLSYCEKKCSSEKLEETCQNQRGVSKERH